ncbi:hypothetical protein [Zunongwangia sp.]|uniref:hypothetical protein n=1 Tax=Zunongwangia sp. TaxID=1965325 RepID=UPI003AA90848
MARRYLVILTKLIFIYCLFYVVMKITAVFQGAWFYANLVMALPILLLGLLGVYFVKFEKYNWFYVIIAALIISAIRYFEQGWLLELHNYFISS